MKKCAESWGSMLNVHFMIMGVKVIIVYYMSRKHYKAFKFWLENIIKSAKQWESS